MSKRFGASVPESEPVAQASTGTQPEVVPGDNLFLQEIATSLLDGSVPDLATPTLEQLVGGPLMAPEPQPASGQERPSDGVESDTGIASQVAVDRFVGATEQIEARWATLDIHERGAAYADAANAELAVAGVPSIASELMNLGGVDGKFESKRWTMVLDSTPFVPDVPEPGVAERVAMSAYHEARHAEQYFRMARLLAERGHDIGAIKEGAGVPGEIAVLAADAPRMSEGERAEAKTWHQDRFGAGREHRKTVMRALREATKTFDDANAAYDRVKDNILVPRFVKERLKAARDLAWETYQRAHEAYLALPVEDDAWDVTDRVEEAYGDDP